MKLEHFSNRTELNMDLRNPNFFNMSSVRSKRARKTNKKS